jgi:hypothetical protein
MIPRFKILNGVGAALISLSIASGANACACCTDFGERLVSEQKMDSYNGAEIRRLQFSKSTELFTGERSPEEIEGIKATSDEYELVVSKQRDRFLFEFHDKEGHSGTLSLILPSFVSVFEVDPREEERRPGLTGPKLYKEWKLTGNAPELASLVSEWEEGSISL